MESPETLRFVTKEECILVFLATGDKTSIGIDIQSAFASWEQLSANEKFQINQQMMESLDPPLRVLYESMISSFNIWNKTQDTDGAPGWRIKESSVADVVKYIGADLMRLLSSMEEAWQKSLKNPAVHLSVKRVESLLQLPDLTRNERDLEDASRKRPRSPEGGGWASERDEGISANDLEKICQIMSHGLNSANRRENGKDIVEANHPSYERLEDLLEAPARALSPASLDNLSQEETSHSRDLLVDDKNADSDFEKQISPILSADDQD